MQDPRMNPMGRRMSQSQIAESWKQVAPLLLVQAMKDNKMTYKDLSARLSGIGIQESADTLNRKVTRKSFSAAFFFMCMGAMDVSEVPIPTPKQVISRFGPKR